MKKFFILSILFLSVYFISCVKTVTYEYELVSLYNEKGSGSFFIGIGSVGTHEYYYGFIKTDKGLVRLKTPTYNCFITEIDTTTQKPRFCIDVSDCCYENVWDFVGDQRHLYVPKGTIIIKYELQ